MRGDLGQSALRVHFSSATDVWATPQDFFDAMASEFCFETDVCALPENAKCDRFYTPEQDGLAQQWQGVCWMNPPYGRTIAAWVRKAYESARGGGRRSSACCRLVPTRPGGTTTS